MIDLKLLIQNGVHFGHQKSKWCPKMQPYIWGFKNNVHLIDVSKTAYQLEKAAKFLKDLASQGKPILWVGTKKSAQDIIKKIATELKAPYVTCRWIGGTFSNYRQVRKSVANLLHFEDVIAKSDQYNYNKKELNVIQKKIDRLEKSVGGIRNLTWPIGAVVVVDVKKEGVCIKEAATMGIPVVALVDTNSDPSGIDYVIPANDDAPRSVGVLLDYLANAVKSGKEAIADAKLAAKAALVEIDEETSEVIDLSDDEDDSVVKSKAADAKVAKKPKVAVKSTAKDKSSDEDDLEVRPKAKPKSKTKSDGSENKK